MTTSKIRLSYKFVSGSTGSTGSTISMINTKRSLLRNVFSFVLCFLSVKTMSYAQQISIIPNVRTETGSYSESSSNFLCPYGTVITGRYHSGDENGTTKYEYATLKAVNAQGQIVAGTITVEDVRWELSFSESSGAGFDAASNRIIVGRRHSGDENGQTSYATAIVKFNGQTTLVSNYTTSANIRESSWNWFRTASNQVVVGRHHGGDENGNTYYRSATIVFTMVPAPPGTIIVPNIRSTTGTYTESSSYFLCPSNTVVTGRSHTGDENGATNYEYATLKAINAQGQPVAGIITVEDVKWGSGLYEADGKGYDAVLNRVIVGRQHSGDENGITWYATGVVKFNGYPTKVINYNTTTTKIESGGWNWFRTVYNQVVTGRHHMGDENGNTYYSMGTISCDVTVPPVDRFRVVLLMHPDEDNFPMNPLDFIRLSRFRRHNQGASDDGFNKNTNRFENNNDHYLQYYDIPVYTVNSYYLPGAPFNVRPTDDKSFGDNKVFLEPDDNLRGDFNPNGRVPVFQYTSSSAPEKREYWIFYGYNYSQAGPLSFSHQGDWEHITLDIVNNSIVKASLSQHEGAPSYTKDQLHITEQNGVQTLYVYSAKGSHAHYPQPGGYNTIFNLDQAADGGYQWVITDNVQNLATQPWRDYAGGWGEVGSAVSPYPASVVTGPLGPWYKRFDFIQSDAKRNWIPLYSYYNAISNTYYYDVTYYPNGPGNNGTFSYTGVLCYVYASPPTSPVTVPVYRYYNSAIADYYYNQGNNPSIGGWANNGLGFYAFNNLSADNNLIPIYSYYNNVKHLLSPDKGISAIFNGGTYTREGVMFYAYPGTYSTSLRVSNQNSSSTAIAERSFVNTIYPNPTTGRFYIQFASPLTKQKIIVMDVNGKLVKQFEGNGSKVEVDISGVAAGVYFVRVQQPDGSVIKHTLVKQ